MLTEFQFQLFPFLFSHDPTVSTSENKENEEGLSQSQHKLSFKTTFARATHRVHRVVGYSNHLMDKILVFSFTLRKTPPICKNQTTQSLCFLMCRPQKDALMILKTLGAVHRMCLNTK